MTGWYRAIALDFDGTIAEDGLPGEALLAAVGESRRAGRRAVLVTGRILEELRQVFPAVDEWFDAIVAENGAVLSREGMGRLLAAPVELELDEALIARGLPFRRGQVLLATQASHEAEVTRELRDLGLECQLVRNRGELMVLPPGISKGFGVYQAFGDLGVSHHSAIGIGDAENDHSLLRTCELGVAVENAVPSLKRHADLVLEKAGSAGVAEFLRGPVVSGEEPLEPRRWRLELGQTDDGRPVRIPASQVNVLVVGRSTGGKSFLAGLLAEQWIGLGYSLCIVDPEGDYRPLGRLRGTLALGGREPLPRPEEIGRLVEHRFGSVLLDLSSTGAHERDRYVPRFLARLEEERHRSGLPHWVLLDEAHHLCHHEALAASRKGYCLVTYRPHELADAVRESIDVVLALPGGKEPRRDGERDPLEAIEALYGLDLGAWRAAEGKALLARPKLGSSVQAFALEGRRTPHVRHWHKYFEGELPPEQHFLFRRESGELRHVGTNVGEFHRALVACEPGVVRHHAGRRDLSRWLRDAVQDLPLARSVRELEEGFRSSPQRESDVEALRFALLRAIEARYLEAPS